MTHKDQASIIYPDAPPAPSPAEEESLDVWGFRDTRFDFSENGHVMIRGSRYELSGKELPRFLPWVREVLECDVNPRNINTPSYPTTIPDPQVSSAFVNDLKQFLRPDQLDKAGEMRLRHGHGHTQEEMYSIKYTRLGRIPDIVVYPESEAEVLWLYHAEGLSFEAIGARLGTSRKVVRALWARGLKGLKRTIEGPPGGPLTYR